MIAFKNPKFAEAFERIKQSRSTMDAQSSPAAKIDAALEGINALQGGKSGPGMGGAMMGAVNAANAAGMAPVAGVAGGSPSAELPRIPQHPQGQQATPGVPTQPQFPGRFGSPYELAMFLQSRGNGMRPIPRVGLGTFRSPGVLLQSPDGLELEEVPSDHVPHYLKLGARRIR